LAGSVPHNRRQSHQKEVSMSEPSIHFNDGAAYEEMMGKWSQIAGNVFLDWLAPTAGLRWLDVGCGNGAFTQVLVDRCAPAEVEGLDPSEGQLAFARARPAARVATFRRGDAMALPFPDDSFDAAAMALVIFFVPDPAKGAAEMARVVRPGGMVATYAWDMPGGGFPLEPIQAELRARGIEPPLPPHADASRMEALRTLWTEAGLAAIETREIAVERTFADFETFWAVSALGASMRPIIAAMTPGDLERLKDRVRARLPADAAGRITYGARANAIKGLVPG
jgi:ubiquinone/menaquinone biosynthesis C-methylase UbiE